MKTLIAPGLSEVSLELNAASGGVGIQVWLKCVCPGWICNASALSLLARLINRHVEVFHGFVRRSP